MPIFKCLVIPWSRTCCWRLSKCRYLSSYIYILNTSNNLRQLVQTCRVIMHLCVYHVEHHQLKIWNSVSLQFVQIGLHFGIELNRQSIGIVGVLCCFGYLSLISLSRICFVLKLLQALWFLKFLLSNFVSLWKWPLLGSNFYYWVWKRILNWCF